MHTKVTLFWQYCCASSLKNRFNCKGETDKMLLKVYQSDKGEEKSTNELPVLSTYQLMWLFVFSSCPLSPNNKMITQLSNIIQNVTLSPLGYLQKCQHGILRNFLGFTWLKIIFLSGIFSVNKTSIQWTTVIIPIYQPVKT